MNRFVLKTQIHIGCDVVPFLVERGILQACIVCDPFIEQSGRLLELTGSLEQADIGFEMFSQVVPDPTIEVIVQGVKRILAHDPGAIIAFGGGSAIDTGKAISCLYTRMTGKPKPLCVAIPTTSGTGSEVTSYSVVSDPEVPAKYPISDPMMLPDIAVLNPALMCSVPPGVTADTGMDVLTHAMEAYASPRANDFSDAMAEKALRLVFDHLAGAVSDGGNLLARERLHNASCMAGIAFEHASLGLCHAMAHALGAVFHIPHGRSNAVLLPHVVAFNAGLEEPGISQTCLRYAKLAGVLGVQRGSPKAAVSGMLSSIRSLSKTIGIAPIIAGLGIDLEEYSQKLEQMATAALADKCLQTNPRIPTKEQIVSVYRSLAVASRRDFM